MERVLAISPHTDDVELGCGGYLSVLKGRGADITVVAMSREYNGKDLEGEFKKSCEVIGVSNILGDFQVRDFKKDRQVLLDSLINLRKEIKPNLVLIPSVSDIHQDHKVIYEEGVRAFSKHCKVLSYELPWNCRGFNPNFYVPLKSKDVENKLAMLDCYKSQMDRQYFGRGYIDAQLRLRGLQINKPYAETFEVVTWIG